MIESGCMGSARKYDVVFLDADGTLFDFERAQADAVRGLFADRDIAQLDGLDEAYAEINASLWKDYEKGLVTHEFLAVERFRRLFSRFGIGVDPTEVGRAYPSYLANSSVLFPGAEEICAWLSERYTLAIITNGMTAVQRGRIARSPIARYIAELVISEEVGCKKPDAAIFEIAAGRVHCGDKSRMLIVGDSLSSDILGGKNFGIDTCWLNASGAPKPADILPTFEIVNLPALRAFL